MSRAEPAQTPLTERQLAILARLAEIGLDIAEAAGRQARGEAGDGATPDAAAAALCFSRAARAVRLTIALQTRLVADRAAADRAEAATRASKAEERRERIHARVEQAIEAEHADADAAEPLSAAVWERLTDADDADLLDRPIEAVVAQICADLGLSPAWAAEAFGDAAAPPDGAQGPPVAGAIRPWRPPPWPEPSSSPPASSPPSFSQQASSPQPPAWPPP